MQSHPSAGGPFTKTLEILSLDFYRRDTKDAIRFLRNARPISTPDVFRHQHHGDSHVARVCSCFVKS